jgi:hypothetical protein
LPSIATNAANRDISGPAYRRFEVVTISTGEAFYADGVFVWSNGSVEAEESCAEVGFGPFARIWLELRLDVDNEGGADGGEQTGLITLSMMSSGKGTQKPTKIKVVLGS